MPRQNPSHGRALSWQGLESGNITFSSELDFDPSELDIVYQDNDTEVQ